MPDALPTLRQSVERLRGLVTPLDDAQLEARAYPALWSIADVMSHLGSGAVIMQRRLEDGLARRPMPDDFAPGVWDVWNAKSPRSKTDDALAADQAALERLETVTPDEAADFSFAMGPMTFDFDRFVGLRLNEHTLHTWDVEVALDPSATLPPADTDLVVDNLALIARWTGKSPGGPSRTIRVRTTEPSRVFSIGITPEAVSFERGHDGDEADLTMPAEAFIRLVYGRLDPDHTPEVDASDEVLDELRRTFPGP
jgi:uncharacterized protein (TIGR03083 family)